MSLTKWMKKLTKEERKHLRENGMTTLTKCEETFEVQRDHNRGYTGMHDCWDCEIIARKLGLWPRE